MLPTYLDTPRVIDGRTYGKLRRVDRQWIIEGEPQVVQMAKRLFPGSKAAGRGRAAFAVSKRLVPELNWLMQRYPLECDKHWSDAIDEARAHVAQSIEIRRSPQAMVPDARFVGTLTDFQEKGVAWMVHHRRTLLADEMGLGKTVQALAFLATAPRAEIYPALIVVQPHTVRQWCRMLERFLPAVGVNVLEGAQPHELLPQPVTIIHYGLLRFWWQSLREQFHCVIFDEIQELRRTGSQKYSAASELGGASEYCIGLSGTPIHNAGGEIWAVLNILELHCLGDWDLFSREWCDGYGSDRVVEPEVLGAHLREQGLVLRRTKDQVLPELPDKRRVIEEVRADEGKWGELIAPVFARLPELAQASQPLERGRLIEGIVSAARHATGLAKAPYVADFVAALLDAGEPGVVFVHHHDVTDTIAEALLRRKHPAVVIDGRRSQREKDEALRAMVEGTSQCALLSLRTSAGIDGLQQRCRWCVFAELDWSPAVHTQAEDRLHRIGLRDSVLAYYLVWPGAGSTDPDVMSRLGFKASQFVGLMGDEPETPEDEQLGVKRATEHMLAVVTRLAALRERSR